MTNEEKKQYIIDAHKLMMKYHIPNNDASLEELKVLDDAHWVEFSNSLLKKQPIKLYKYYSCDNNYSIDTFKNDNIWFNHPNQFNDSLDSSINIDVVEEKEYIKSHLEELTAEYSEKFIYSLAKSLGVNVSSVNIQDCIDCYSDGKINEERTRNFLKTQLPNDQIDLFMKKIERINSSDNQQILKYAVEGFLQTYIDCNNNTRSNILTFCLSEEKDNDAMWGLYANNCTGFCVEYIIPYDTIKSQMLRVNLLPIYYGNKEHISVNDLLMHGVFCDSKDNVINGLIENDYRRMIISMLTKKECWKLENEWRITLLDNMNSNLYHFPYASSIILGENMSDSNRNRLIEIAKCKGISIYERSISRCGSAVVEVIIN